MADVNELLMKKDWGALDRFFASSEPVTAAQFQARALLALSREGVRPDWLAVIADMQRACELSPSDGILRANLAQALLDSGQPEPAYREATKAVQLAPQAYAPLEKLAVAAAATRRWTEALALLQRAAQVLDGKRPLPPAAAQLMARLHTRWWEPLKIAGLTLRRPDIADTSFLRALFSDASFMRRFHRFQATGADASRRFIDVSQQPPEQSRRLDWIVHDRTGNPSGLASLVDIDFPNRRGELLVGFPGEPPAAMALQASVAIIRFAFERLQFAKLVSYVYGDNQPAQSNTLHLGFRQEGLLRSHIAAEGQRVDLFVNGMTRGDYDGNALLRKLAVRWKP